jgi:alcohol dehydrogenase (cytochrome c)
MPRALRLLPSLLLLTPRPACPQVSAERLLNAAREPASWLTYSGDYAAHRFSRLAQITPANVARLRPAWVYQARDPGDVQTTPLVTDGVMYVTEGKSHVAALDLKTGNPLWRWERSVPDKVKTLGFGPTNRGVAILDTTVYVGTLEAHLVALDSRTGVVRWDAPVASNDSGYAITGAPLVADGKVIVGVSGGEAGIRGFLDAYDARTGQRLWRFWTIPAPGEPGHETWTGDAWKTGGGSTWVTGSFDPDLGLVYWGVGNPGPDWNGDVRPGDNLYTCSLLALDVRTGALRWHFQFTPHDTHDWDAAQIPVLADVLLEGRRRKVVVMANRNAFYYVLDRATGEFLHGVAFSRQTWADGLDERGRPRVIPGTEPSDSGSLVYPSLQGATNWLSPAFSPITGLLYVPATELGSIYYKREAKYAPGTFFNGGGEQAFENDSSFGVIRALAIGSGARRWEFRLQSLGWAGVLATAGGLVFGGTNEGRVFALDATSGRPLWQFQTGGVVGANPISFLIGGKQHIAIAAGRSVYVFGLP